MAMHNLAIAYHRQGKHSDAEKLQIEVVNIRNRLGEEHSDTINAMGNLAVTYNCLGKHADAEELEIKALHLTSRLLGDEHPSMSLHMYIRDKENMQMQRSYKSKF